MNINEKKHENMRKMGGKMQAKSKSAQVTIFVIIAIAIVAILIIVFFPQLKKIVVPATPESLIPSACIETAIKENYPTIMERGGSMNPALYIRYQNITVEYLCYTSQWYQTCTMQKPLLKQSIEKEIQKTSNSAISKCMGKMQADLESKGYDVKITGDRNPEINIVPQKISIIFNNMTMTLEKDGETTIISGGKFKTNLVSESYDLIMIASSIQNFEARYGDIKTDDYMTFYPNIKVEKKLQSDGSKVYIITHRETKEVLQFATRSLAWPPGYAIQEGYVA